MNLIQTFLLLLFSSVFALALPNDELGFPILSHDYDEREQAGIRYDAASLLTFDYDSAALLVAYEKESRIAGRSAIFSNFAEFVAAKTAPIRWGPLNGPGPLGEKVASTFRGGSYTELVTSESTTLYRVYGGNSRQIGPYWTRTPPAGPLQSRIDNALNPAWGNTAENVVRIQVPAGTRIFEGFAAPQGGLVGGGNQVFIQNVNPGWILP